MATKTKRNSPASATQAMVFPWWGWCIALSAVVYALFQIYDPAMHAEFLFDDLFLPYSKSNAKYTPLSFWLGVRPVLGVSYWLDYHWWTVNTFPYHAMNLLLHFGAGCASFFVFRKLLELGSTPEPMRTILSAFGTALFWFHPIQTEVAAYTASRSESLSVGLLLCAFCAFLYRPNLAIDWHRSIAVISLFLLALGSKEHAVTFPALLLLTDYFWNPGFSVAGIKANWRLYIPIGTIAAAGALLLSIYLVSDPMIGFHLEGLNPAAYFFTECRVVWKYIQLFLFPVTQTVDYDFPISHSPLEHGSLFALAALLLFAAAAFLYRRQYPFAAYGYFAFLLLLSPTSSIVPINDPIVERRLYLPFFALVLILFEPLRRVRARPLALASSLAAVCCVAAYATSQRAKVWSDTFALFQDATEKAPNKARVRIGYANALYHRGRCSDALREYDKAIEFKPADYILDYNIGAAYYCIHQPDEALRMLSRSIDLVPKANAYTLKGLIYNEKGDFTQAFAHLTAALMLDNYYSPAFAYRGVANAALGKIPEADYDFRRCLELDRNNKIARQGLAVLNQQRPPAL